MVHKNVGHYLQLMNPKILPLKQTKKGTETTTTTKCEKLLVIRHPHKKGDSFSRSNR